MYVRYQSLERPITPFPWSIPVYYWDIGIVLLQHCGREIVQVAGDVYEEKINVEEEQYEVRALDTMANYIRGNKLQRSYVL